jgi:Uma2 family endonuclease
MTPVVGEERMTAAEFIKKYGDCSGVELVRGRVVWAGRAPEPAGGFRMPRFKHGVVSHRVHRAISDFVDTNKLGWVAINDTFVTVSQEEGTVRGADVLFVSYSRLPAGPVPEDLPVAPDLVVEVRSPTDRIGDIQIKIGEYLNAGVRVVVLVDPNTESVAVFRADELPQRFSNGDELTLPDVLPGFAVPVRRFFE